MDPVACPSYYGAKQPSAPLDMPQQLWFTRRVLLLLLAVLLLILASIIGCWLTNRAWSITVLCCDLRTTCFSRRTWSLLAQVCSVT